ncbi:MAG TPA: hypothetical protein VFY66_06825 [Anaerolineales bacterium]|nr:hypothetical protein [Anaerolineales bacterium]
MKENKNQRKSPFPVILTLTGILIGLLLSLLAVWADYESISFGFPRRAQAPLRGLTCPVFMGRNESKTVSLKISNPTDRNLSAGVRTQISTSTEPVSEVEGIRLAPGEQKTIQRTVGPENIDFGMFIFVDALVYAVYPMPDRETTCGILVLPVTNGTYALIFGTVLSILFLGVGNYLLYKNDLPARRSRPLLFLVIATLLAMILGYSGVWLAAFLLIILCLLTLLYGAGNLFTSQL